MDLRALETLTKVFDCLKDAIWSFDLIHQKYIYVNERFTEMYGASVEELNDEPFKWRTTVHPDDYGFVDKETQRLYLGENVDLEFRVVVNGQVRWIRDRKLPVLDSGGRLFAVVGLSSDITDKKSTNLFLTDSEYTYRYLFLNNPNPLWIYDRETLSFVTVNNAAISEYGYTEEEFLSMKITDIRPPEDISKLMSAVRKVRGVHSRNQGWRHLTRDGRLLDVIISGHGVNFNDRDCEIIMVHNVTEMVRAREELIVAKTNLDASINNISNMIWSVDSDYRVLSANSAFRTLIKEIFDIDIHPGDSIFMNIVTKDRLEKWKTLYDRVLTGEVIVFNHKIFGLDNIHEIRMNPIYHNDEIIGVVSQARDIQDALDEAIRVQKQNEDLRKIVELASHDIRGPVASLMGIVPLFNDSEPNDPFNADIINHVRELTIQLDSILHKIVDQSYMLQQDNTSTDASQQSQSANE